MIRAETVLTATPIILDCVPDSYSLHDNVNNIVKGLDAICFTSGTYTLNDLVLTLPKATDENSQHEIVMAESVSKISEAVRQSLLGIKKYIIPTCDKIEKAIKSIGQVHTTEDLMFAKLYLDFIHINDAFFTSTLFPDAPEDGYDNGLLFDSSNITQLGQWPKLSYGEIISLIPETDNYPELAIAINDSQAVEKAWGALGEGVQWLGTINQKVNPKQLEVTADLKSLIVLTLLINKLSIMDDPVKGIVGISLNDYRIKINNTKSFLNSLLYYTRKRLTYSMAGGLAIIEKEMSFEKCEDDKSQFLGTDVLNGKCTVLYNDAVSDFFATSEHYSLSESVVGLLLSRIINGYSEKSFLDNVEQYNEYVRDYLKELSRTVNKNAVIATRHVVFNALREIAQSPEWEGYLSQNGEYRNTAYRLEKLITDNGGIIEPLSVPNINRRIRDGSLSVANTRTSVVLARVLGLPIAANILENNLSDEHLTLEQQRKTLAKAITRYIASVLVKG